MPSKDSVYFFYGRSTPETPHKSPAMGYLPLETGRGSFLFAFNEKQFRKVLAAEIIRSSG
jgi:hypothetical protein